MKKPFIIGIAGESGASKSSLAEIISIYYGPENVTVLSTDDLHLYTRDNPVWETITHPDPLANNLRLGNDHLAALAQGIGIWRSTYNHHCGYFNPPVFVDPKPVIIIEGLHAFYTQETQAKIDLKIYVDTDSSLTTHWKLIRDTTQRGYTKEKVLETMKRRESANKVIRKEQMEAADVTIDIWPAAPLHDIGNPKEEVKLSVSVKYSHTAWAWREVDHIFSFILRYISDFDEFILACETLGTDPELCQDAGGNISVKTAGSNIIIKASGVALGDVTRMRGYSVIKDGNFIFGSRPSMEAGFHTLLKGSCVLHAHPIYLTLLLCLENSKDIFQEHFSNGVYVPYATPGTDLCRAIENAGASEIYYLENHGIIVQQEEQMSGAINLVKDMNLRALNYIREQLIKKQRPLNLLFYKPGFESAPMQKVNFCFPDSALLYYNANSHEVRTAENYIELTGRSIGNLRYLSTENVQALRNMGAEKYRQSKLETE